MIADMWADRFKAWLPKGPRIDPQRYVGDDPRANDAAVRRGFASKAKSYLKHLPLAREVVAMYFCMLDARTPIWVKTAVGGALAYFILPFDAVPDFLPMIGFGDDVGIIAATLSAVSSHVTNEHREQAQGWIANEKIVIIDVPTP